MATSGDQGQEEGTGGGSLVCDLCDSQVDTPLSKCIDCDVYMCMICTKGHKRVKQTSDHQILTDQDVPSPRSRSVSDNNVPLPCSTSKPVHCIYHAEEDVSFYCYTCKKLICSLCITENHSKHKCSVIKHAAQDITKELSNSLAEMKENKMAKLSSKIQEVEKKQQENSMNGESNAGEITDRRNNFVSQINEISERLIQEDQKTTEQHEQYLTNILQDLKIKHSKMEETYTEYSNILSTGSDTEKIEAWINSESRMNEHLLPEEEVEIHLCKFVPGEADISCIISSFGSFDDENGSDFCSDATDGPISRSVPPIPQSKRTAVRIRLSSRSAPPLPQSSEPVHPLPPREKLQMSKSTPSRLQQTPPPENRPKEPQLSSSLNESSSPISSANRSLSTTRNPPKAVTSPEKSITLPRITNRTTSPNLDERQSKPINIDTRILSRFSLETTDSITAMCPVTATSMLIHCVDQYNNTLINSDGTRETVSLDFIIWDMVKVGNQIFATDFENKIIHKLDTSSIKKKQEINIALVHPLRLCSSSDGTLLVTMTDAWSYKIKKDSRRYVARLKYSGREIDSYEYDGRGKRMFTLPASVAENINGDICVLNRLSDSRTNIVILDRIGRLKVIYSGEPNKPHFDAKRVTCDKFGHIIITDESTESVHLLDSNGQFIQYLTKDKQLGFGHVSLAIDMSGQLWLGCTRGHVFVMKYIKDQ